MTGRALSRLAWVGCGAALVLILLSLVLIILGWSTPLPRGWTPWRDQVVSLLGIIGAPIVGGLIASRRPHNPYGWLWLGFGSGLALQKLAESYAAYALAVEPGSLVAPRTISHLLDLGGPLALSFAPFLLLFFPDGRPLSHRWRPLSWISATAGAMLLVLVLLFGRPEQVGGAITITTVGVVSVMFASIALSALSLVIRYRRASGLERQQLKWVAFAAALVGVFSVGQLLLPGWLLDESLLNFLDAVANTSLYAAVGIAILRHRLYDIDVVINRALVYGALTVSVVGIYVLVVGYLGASFRTDYNLVVSLVATGLVAVLFQPLRERLQRGVNRLMYGERDDPYAVLSRLGRRLEGTLAPETVLPAVVENIARALRLPHVAVWLADGDGLHLEAANGETSSTTAVQDARAVETLRHSPDGTDPVELGASEAYGRVLATSNVGLVLPLFHGGELIGALCMAPRGPGESFSTADRRLLRDLATQVSAAANSVRLTGDLRSSLEDLRRSREELVAAQGEERRRVQRDLHDGLGPVLASMRLRLEACLDTAQEIQTPLTGDLERLYDLVGQATSDIRRLVYDLRPPVLDQLGLVEALGQHCERFSRESGIEVGFDARPDLSIPAAAEVTILRVVQEALLNVQKHARASRADVRLEQREGYLELGVRDDGTGLDAGGNGDGTGIGSMRERAELLGGTLRLAGGSGAGTKVTLRVPVEEVGR